MAEDII